MATHLINRIPTPILNWHTPFEVLYGHKPDYSMVKTFGCLCYITNTKPHKDKFETRSHKCVFLGYCLGKKAYKVYDIDTKQIYISRDIIFHKYSFPFHTDMKFDDETPLPSIPIIDGQDNVLDIESTSTRDETANIDYPNTSPQPSENPPEFVIPISTSSLRVLGSRCRAPKMSLS